MVPSEPNVYRTLALHRMRPALDIYEAMAAHFEGGILYMY
jgi:hypothetical protein